MAQRIVQALPDYAKVEQIFKSEPDYLRKHGLTESRLDRWCSPVHAAARIGCENIIALLIRNGADPNAYEGFDTLLTPLHLAVLNRNPSLVQCLLDFGADLNLPRIIRGVTEDGTILDHAEEKYRVSKDQKIRDILIILKNHRKSLQRVSKPMAQLTISAPVLNHTSSSLAHNLNATAPSAPPRLITAPTRPAPLPPAARILTKPTVPPPLPASVKQRIIIEKSLKLQQDADEIRAEMEKLRLKLNAIETNPDFKKPEEIEAMTNEARKCIKEDDFDVSCPICFEEPGEIYCCVECDNMVCGDCEKRIKRCPMCRLDFGVKPPKRNRFAERILKK